MKIALTTTALAALVATAAYAPSGVTANVHHHLTRAQVQDMQHKIAQHHLKTYTVVSKADAVKHYKKPAVKKTVVVKNKAAGPVKKSVKVVMVPSHKKGEEDKDDKDSSDSDDSEEGTDASGDEEATDASGDEEATDASGDEEATDASGDEEATDASGDEEATDASGDEEATDASGDEEATDASGDEEAESASGYEDEDASGTGGDKSKLVKHHLKTQTAKHVLKAQSAKKVPLVKKQIIKPRSWIEDDEGDKEDKDDKVKDASGDDEEGTDASGEEATDASGYENEDASGDDEEATDGSGEEATDASGEEATDASGYENEDASGEDEEAESASGYENESASGNDDSDESATKKKSALRHGGAHKRSRKYTSDDLEEAALKVGAGVMTTLSADSSAFGIEGSKTLVLVASIAGAAIGVLALIAAAVSLRRQRSSASAQSDLATDVTDLASTRERTPEVADAPASTSLELDAATTANANTELDGEEGMFA